MAAKMTVAYEWTCRDCDETGTTFASCERHSEKAGHDVWWTGRPQ